MNLPAEAGASTGGLRCLRVGLAGSEVIVCSAQAEVVGWVDRYIGGWWAAERLAFEPSRVRPVIAGTVDPAAYTLVRAHVGRAPEDARLMLSANGQRRSSGGLLCLVNPASEVAYIRDRRRNFTNVIGSRPEQVMVDVGRLTRTFVTTGLELRGWVVLHAGCVVRPDGYAILLPGASGSGKTTASLILPQLPGWHHLASDLCLVMAQGPVLRVAPVPTSVSVGLGLLDALGWADRVAAEIRAGAVAHPCEPAAVRQRILARDVVPRYGSSGRELKLELFPDQLSKWFGVNVAGEAEVAEVMFPRIDDTAPSLTAVPPGPRGLEQHLVWGPAGGYPNFLQLRLPPPPAERPSAGPLLDALGRLPARRLALCRDVARNKAFCESALNRDLNR